jgi:hypothetical protein
MISSCTNKRLALVDVSVKRVISQSDREDACRKLVVTGSRVKTGGTSAEKRDGPNL